MMNPGDIVGSKYQIERLIGSGAYGTCYHVYDTEEKQHRVLKTSNNQEAYNREMEALTAVQNTPGFVHLFHGFIIGCDHYLVMSDEGETALTLLKRNRPARFSQKNVIRIGVRLFELIHQLHDHGFSHGDLHLENVMFRRDSAGKINVTLIDFGTSVNLNLRPDGNAFKQMDYRTIVELLFDISDESGSRWETFRTSEKGQKFSPWEYIQEENNKWIGDLSVVVNSEDKAFDFSEAMDFFKRVLRNFEISSGIEYTFDREVVRIT